MRTVGITVSIGMSLTKSLAKICSSFRKPYGFTGVPGKYIHVLLQRTQLSKVCGFGPNTVSLLQKHGLKTAYDYAIKPEQWASKLLHKPGHELWRELRGTVCNELTLEEKHDYASIMKSRTFSPSSKDRNIVFARLVWNAESAFIKARRYRLRAKVLTVILRHQDYRHHGLEARLNRPTSSALEAMPLVRHLFNHLFEEGSEYRATMLILGKLESDTSEQPDLFEDRLRIEDMRKISGAIDEINKRYGKHTLRSAVSLYMNGRPEHPRNAPPERRRLEMKGETTRQRLAIPRMSVKV